MKIRRSIACIVMAAMLCATFSGCSGNSKGTDEIKKAAEVTYATCKESTGASVAVVNNFNKKFDGRIKVKYVEMPADSDKAHDDYVTALAAGSSEYDVIDIDVTWPAEFSNAGWSIALDKFIKKDQINMDDYMQSQVDAGTFKGQLWAFPQFTDAGVLNYRTDIIKNPPSTWEELIKDAKAYKGQGGTKFGYVMQAKQYEGLVCNAVEFISAYGGSIVDGNGNITINSPETIKGLTVMKEIVKSDFVPNNITNFGEDETYTAYLEGQSVFARNWPYMNADANDPTKSKISGKTAMCSLPKGDKRASACLGGWMTIINKYSKDPNSAWQFVKYMCGEEGQKTRAIVGGYAPTLLSLYKDKDVVAKNPDFGKEAFVQALEAAVPRPVSPIYAKLSEVMQIELSKMLAGQESVEEAVKNMSDKMTEAESSSK